MSEIYPLNTFCDENEDKYEVFENLCREFSEEIDYHKKTKILHSLVQTYLLHFKEQLEANIKTAEFFGSLSQIPVLCSKFLKTSTSDPSLSNDIASTTNLDDKSQNLESASLCFDAVLACLEAFSESKQCTVIIKISLNILFQGYTHCKESELIYNDFLEQFAEQLGSFFKKIENLQMVVLQQLDKLNIAKCLGEDHFNCIVIEMGNLCQVVFSLDADIAFELWAKYNRIITGHTSLNQISNINAVSTHLASKNNEILQTIKFNQDKHSEEDEEVSAKLFFYLDALSSMMNLAHNCFKGNLSEFRTFLLNLLECLVSSYSPFTPDKTCLNIIKSSLVKNAFVLSSYLYVDEEFLRSVLQTTSDEQTHFGNLLFKLCALQFMKSASLQLKKDFFKDIFSTCLSGNSKDDMKFLCNTIPLCTVTKTDSDELVTLYQFAYEQITEFSKLIPDSVIKELESTILGYLVSSSDVIYLLISDIWMFRLRYGSMEFLKACCYSILKSLSMEAENNTRTDSFIKRMLRFLPTSYKDSLLQEFSFFKFIQENESMQQNRYGVPYNTSIDDEEWVYSEEQVDSMILKLNEDFTNDPIQLVQKASMCLKLCTYFLNASDSSATLQCIEFASELFKTDVYEIQIEVLTFLKALSRKKFPEHTQEFGEIVTFVAKLFSEAIHSKNFIVRYEARNTFSYFAKNTPHIKIFQETVRRDPSLKPIMKSYINALPDNDFLSEKEKILYLKQQMQAMNVIQFGISQRSAESLQHFFSKGNFKLLA